MVRETYAPSASDRRALVTAACGIFVLSCSSSLDNFIVGLSLGVSDEVHALSWSLNGIISACNAAGALSSAYLGKILGSRAPALAGLAAAGIFLYLAYGEVDAYVSGGESTLSREAAAGRAWVVAVPMTLNNLAGGVAGGLAGYSALAMGACAYIASFLLMQLGFACGVTGGARFTDANPHAFSAAAFGFLALSQLAEYRKTSQARRRRESPVPNGDAYLAVPLEDLAPTGLRPTARVPGGDAEAQTVC